MQLANFTFAVSKHLVSSVAAREQATESFPIKQTFLKQRPDPSDPSEGSSPWPKWNYDSPVCTAALVVTRPIENTVERGNSEIGVNERILRQAAIKELVSLCRLRALLCDQFEN